MRKAILAIPILFFSVFFFYPILSLLRFGIYDSGFTGRYLSEVLSNAIYLKIILFTIYQAFLSAVFTLLIGLPGAYIMGNYDFRGKSLIKAISTVPFILPSIVVVLGFLALFGRNGIINGLLSPAGIRISILYSLQAIVLAHAFYNFPVVMRIVGSSWASLDSKIEDAGRSLGASPFQLFRRVTLPMLLPSIVSAFTLVFAYCFMSFAVVLILGGVKYSTIEVEIYSLSSVQIRPHLASALSILQIAISLVFMRIYLGWGKERGRSAVRRMKRLSSRISVRALLLWVYGALIVALIIGPMLAVLYYSLISGWGGSFTYHWYANIFSSRGTDVLGISPASVVANSLFFAMMTVAATVPLAVMTAYGLRGPGEGKKTAEAIFMLPLAVSSVTLGWSFISAFLSTGLYGTWALIVAAHSIIAFPLVFRAVHSSVSSSDPALTEAARTLGASPAAAFLTVELPQIMPGIIVGATFAFAISLGEFGATLLLYRPEYTTLPIAIYKMLGTRAFGSAAAMSVLLIVLATASFLLIERMGGRRSVFQ